MIRTRGVHHVQLAVADLVRSTAFYADVFGFEIVLRRENGVVLLQTPGAQDSLVLCQARPAPHGEPNRFVCGIEHVGLRVDDPSDVDRLVALAIALGGRLLDSGPGAGGGHHVYLEDPDGAVIRV